MINITVSVPNVPSVAITGSAGAYTVVMSGVGDFSTVRVPTSEEHTLGVPYRSHQATYKVMEGDPPVEVEHTVTVNDSRIWPLEVVRPSLGEAVRNALALFGVIMETAYREAHPDVVGASMVGPLLALEGVKARTMEAVNAALQRAGVAAVGWE